MNHIWNAHYEWLHTVVKNYWVFSRAKTMDLAKCWARRALDGRNAIEIFRRLGHVNSFKGLQKGRHSLKIQQKRSSTISSVKENPGLENMIFRFKEKPYRQQ